MVFMFATQNTSFVVIAGTGNAFNAFPGHGVNIRVDNIIVCRCFPVACQKVVVLPTYPK